MIFYDSLGSLILSVEDHATIIRCMAESYWSGKGEDTIKACRECFKGVGNPLSEEGLPKAKECTRQFLPKENEACASLIAELTPNDMEKGEKGWFL